MLDFSRFIRVEAKVIVARDILNENKGVALVSKEFAGKFGIKEGQTVKLTRNGRTVKLVAKPSEFAEGVDVVIPNDFFASQLVDFDSFKQFTASVELER